MLFLYSKTWKKEKQFNPSDFSFTAQFGRNMMIFSDHSNRSTLMDVLYMDV